MDQRELSARLPAPRDDEPSALRQDILDELADHLHCSMRRELLATGDVATAQERVLEKFGDPADVARRLWIQAMWSKIMSQRLMLGSVGVLTALCIGLAGLAIWLTQQQQVAAAQQQQVVADMMATLARLAESEGNKIAAVSRAASIAVKLTVGTPDGPPVADCEVTLQQLGFDKEKVARETSDPNGSADFGYCDPGRYEMTIRTAWGFKSTPKRFILHPGTAQIERVACPARPEEARVSFITNIPQDLEELGVQVMAPLDAVTLMASDEIWREQSGNLRNVLVKKDGWEVLSASDLRIQSSGFRDVVDVQGRSLNAVFVGPTYFVRGLRLVGPFRGPSTPQGASRFFEQIAPKRLPPTSPERMRNESMTTPLNLQFVADTGKLNEWIIPVPDELIEQAREHFRNNPRADRVEQ